MTSVPRQERLPLHPTRTKQVTPVTSCPILASASTSLLEPDATTSASAPVLAVAVDGALRVRTLAPSLLVPLENEHELLRRWLSSVLWAG